MSWLGKMVGGTIGFAIGGPIGAIAGAAFGHTFDKKEKKYLGYDEAAFHDRLSNTEEAQLTFFIAAFSMLAKIAKADGRVTDKEIASVESFMRHELNLSGESMKTAQNIFREAVHSNESFEDFARQLYGVFRTQPRLIELMMDVLVRVSAVDGKISPEEEALLHKAAEIFNISEQAYATFKSKYVRDVNRYYALLNCDESWSDEQIKKQYRKMVSEYHPDKIAAKGLPEEFVKFANDKFREIQEAWEQIKKERGID